LHVLSVEGRTQVLVKDKELIKKQEVHSSGLERVEPSFFFLHLFHAVINQNLLRLSLKSHCADLFRVWTEQ